MDTLGRRYELLRPHLNELQRRLWLGVEAAELGVGGVGIVAQATGVAADTVRRGRAEIDGGQVGEPGRSRKPGGGRKRAEQRDEQARRRAGGTDRPEYARGSDVAAAVDV